MTEERQADYEVVVIGGGAAGLSGALMLARARRSVLVIDSGAPRNAPAAGAHGLLGHDGIAPNELLERGRKEVRGYGAAVVSGQVVGAGRDETGATLTLADGRTVRARRLLVSTGVVDELPDVPGLRERWGKDVLHCPYCHGWEVRDQPIGVLAGGPMSLHQALLFRQWSNDVRFFAHTCAPPEGEQAEQLAARGIDVVPGEVASLEVADDRLVGVRLADGTVLPRAALVVAPRMTASAQFLAQLGLRAVEHPTGVGEYVPSDATGRTDVPGVWVAGNVTDLMAQVGAAAAAGANAAAQINAELVTEEAERAVAARRALGVSTPEGESAIHDHHHGEDVDWNAMGEVIERRAELYRPLYAQIIDAVRERSLDPGRIVDAGSGPGVVSVGLAEAFPTAEVLALDSAPALLQRAQRRARDAGLAARVDTRRGEIPEAFTELHGADVVWLGQSLHHVGDQQAALAAAARSLAPGGLLVLLEGGLPARWLPREIGIGRPGLQSRLTAMNEAWFAAMRAGLPGATHPVEDWAALLTAAGLRHTATRSFLLDLPAPVEPPVREHVVTTLERLRDSAAEHPDATGHLDADDSATIERLLDPDDPEGLQQRPDVFLLDAQTVHFAVKE